jgi:heat shock protein HslJ
MITKHTVCIAAAVLICGIAGGASAASNPIENTDWTLATLGDNPLTTWQSLAPVNFRLDASTKRIAGITGCNRVVGAYHLSSDRLSFSQLASTRMMCISDRTMQLESDVTKVLLATTNYRMTSGRLELYAGQQLLASFSGR